MGVSPSYDCTDLHVCWQESKLRSKNWGSCLNMLPSERSVSLLSPNDPKRCVNTTSAPGAGERGGRALPASEVSRTTVNEVRKLMGLLNSTNAGQTEFKEDLCCRSRKSLQERKWIVWLLMRVQLGRELDERAKLANYVGISQGSFSVTDSCPLLTWARGWPGPQRCCAAWAATHRE